MFGGLTGKYRKVEAIIMIPVIVEDWDMYRCQCSGIRIDPGIRCTLKIDTRNGRIGAVTIHRRSLNNPGNIMVENHQKQLVANCCREMTPEELAMMKRKGKRAY